MEIKREMQDFICLRKADEVCLMPVFHKAKELYGELSLDVLKYISGQMQRPFSEIVSTATFYSAFFDTEKETEEEFLREPETKKDRYRFLLGYHSDYRAVGKMIREQIDVFQLLRDAKVCGKSGSGYPMAEKWRMVKETKSEKKYIICNGSEGEGNTFKDDLLFCKKPESIIEGMLICGLSTGIRKGYIYVKSEYKEAYESLKNAIVRAYAANLLGEDILGIGSAFYLEVVSGGGAYVSGEETGLLQTLEGKRAEPRIKPPYPVQCGLYGCPTIINNAESFAAVPALIMNGADAFKEAGSEDAGGSKLYTVCGSVENPGIYETEHTITPRRLLKLAGGPQKSKRIKGFQIGGAATGGFGSQDDMDMILDYRGCKKHGLALGTASVYFISSEESVPELSLKSISFLKDQSCGMCIPCKYGLPELEKLLSELCRGEGDRKTLMEIKKLCRYIDTASRCALGQSSPTAVVTAMENFSEEFDWLCGKGI